MPGQGLITVSYSELDTYRQCPLKWWLGYGQRWTRPVREGSALDKGTLWHAVLEAHYKTLQSLRPEFKLVEPEQVELELARKAVEQLLYHPRSGEYLSDTAELIGWMYDGYVERWGADRHWKILAVEHAPVIALRTPRGGTSRFRLKAKIDLIVRDEEFDSRVWVVDHKSGQNLPSQKELDIDDQFGLYTLLMRRLGIRVFGSLYNAARTQRNKSEMKLDDRMGRYRLHRTDQELDAIEEDAYLTASAAYGVRPSKVGGSGGHGFHSAPNTDQCKWKCDFLDAHLLARKGVPMEEALVGFGFEQRFERH